MKEGRNNNKEKLCLKIGKLYRITGCQHLVGVSKTPEIRETTSRIKIYSNEILLFVKEQHYPSSSLYCLEFLRKREIVYFRWATQEQMYRTVQNWFTRIK